MPNKSFNQRTPRQEHASRQLLHAAYIRLYTL
jgi:hypothetical protein